MVYVFIDSYYMYKEIVEIVKYIFFSLDLILKSSKI